MPRAETIDRIALTKQHSRFLQAVDEMRQEEPQQSEHIYAIPEEEKCPVCGAVLLHIGGCVECPNKCYSRCG